MMMEVSKQHDDDSSDGGAEEMYMDEDGGVDNKTNKPWVPAIEDPNYFEVLSPEEIYDSFFSIRRMGFIANRIIRKLNETKHIVSSKILEKRKKLKALQRKQFEQLSPAGIEYLKVLLKMEIAAIKNTTDAGLSPSASIKCRLAHLALDINTSNILTRIYDADAIVHTLELWKVLALDYVNNPMWQPRRAVNDDRLHDIDPARAPEEKFTPESLRSVFSRLRIDYTKALLKFTSNIKITVPVARESLDQEFWERYAKHDKALYYLYHLFRDRPLQDCLLVDHALMRQDTLDHLDTPAHGQHNQLTPGMVSGVNVSRLSTGGINTMSVKRDREAAGLAGEDEDPLDLMDAEQQAAASLYGAGAIGGSASAAALKRMRHANGDLGVALGSGSPEELAWQAGVKKDRAVANYYKRLTINADIRFYQELLTKENVGEAIKRNAKTKMNLLLMKKIEDRYDDLIF